MELENGSGLPFCERRYFTNLRSLGFQWHLLYSFSNPLLPNRLWLEAQLYCRLPSGYVDPNTYYLEPGYLFNDDNNILQLDDLNRRASIPTSLTDPTLSESYAEYGKSVLSSVLQHLETGSGRKELLDLAVTSLGNGNDHWSSSGLVQVVHLYLLNPQHQHVLTQIVHQSFANTKMLSQTLLDSKNQLNPTCLNFHILLMIPEKLGIDN